MEKKILEIKMYLQKYIGIYDDVLPHTILSNLLKYCNYVDFEKSKILTSEGGNVENSDIRRAEIKNLFNYGVDSLTEIHWSNYLFSKFFKAIDKYTHDKKLFDCGIGQVRDIALLKYENTGFYKWHVDHAWSAPRTLSMIFLLNNDYEGGELCFREGDGSNEITIDKKPNRIVIWPSNFLYPHTVKPVTKGTRYSVVCWAL